MRSIRRSTVRSITTAPRRASTRPRALPNAERAVSTGLGTAASPTAAALRGPVNGNAVAAAAAPTANALRW